VPSTKMYWVVAPAALTPSIQAWLSSATRALEGSSWNSLLQSKITLSLLANSVATLVQKVWKSDVEVKTVLSYLPKLWGSTMACPPAVVMNSTVVLRAARYVASREAVMVPCARRSMRNGIRKMFMPWSIRVWMEEVSGHV
jgi:hypothetical protein